jgi:rhodanese-related sulfurtransferase
MTKLASRDLAVLDPYKFMAVIGNCARAGRRGQGPIVDIRQAPQFASGHIAGAWRVELGSVADAELRRRQPVTLMCGHGQRAMSAASILEAGGHHELAVVLGGPSDRASSSGRALETGR